MSINVGRAASVRNDIRSYYAANASGLTSIPAIENDSQRDATRKLQVQVFTLTDALVDLTAAVTQLAQRVEQLESRRR